MLEIELTIRGGLDYQPLFTDDGSIKVDKRQGDTFFIPTAKHNMIKLHKPETFLLKHSMVEVRGGTKNDFRFEEKMIQIPTKYLEQYKTVGGNSTHVVYGVYNYTIVQTSERLEQFDDLEFIKDSRSRDKKDMLKTLVRLRKTDSKKFFEQLDKVKASITECMRNLHQGVLSVDHNLIEVVDNIIEEESYT
jgi:hypothetical protein